VASGNHTVIITDAAGCSSAPISIDVVTGPALTGTVAPTPTSCSGASDGSVTVTPSTGSTPFEYSLDGTSWQSSNTFSALPSGDITVFIRDAAGCMSAAIPVTIAVGPALTATVATTPTSCSGAINGTVTVTPTNGTGPFDYSIDGINFQSSNTFTGLATGTYTISFRNAGGCQSSVQATVEPGQPLTATVSVNNVLCNGGNSGEALVNISSNGAAPYEYSLDGTTWQSSNSFTGLAAGNYTVLFRDQNNCAGTQDFNVTQPAPLSITSAEQAALCNGQTNGQIMIAVQGGTSPYQYSLDGVNYQASNSFSVSAGSYTVYVKDNNNCVLSEVVDIAEPSVLSGSVVTTNATCDGGNNGTITLNATGGTQAYQYSINGTSFQSSNVFNVTAGSYNTIIKDANGCAITQTATVDLTNNLTVTPAADLVACEGVSVQLEPITNANQFVWTPAQGLSATNIRQPLATPSVSTDYIVNATLGVCTAADTIRVNIMPAPIPDAGPDGDICYGQTYNLQGNGGVEYIWSPTTYLNGSVVANPVVTPEQTIQYTLNVVDANGCRSLQPDVVNVNVTPPIVVKISRDTVVAYGDVFQLFATSEGTNYEWSPSFGLDDPYKATPNVTVTGDITYTVTVTTSAGCMGEASVTLKVFDGPEIYMPTAFTPNGDGKNDVFKPFPVGIKNYTYFRVFNRWGQMIFSTTDFNKGWDGTINGKPQPTGVYVWVIEGITKEDKKMAKKGTVTLIR
jgi:gliding motility-associated-like protein